jgi:hypothetical protein
MRVPQPQLSILVAPKCIELSTLCHNQAVRVPTCHFSDAMAGEEGDWLGDKHIIRVSMPKPPKVTPAQSRVGAGAALRAG